MTALETSFSSHRFMEKLTGQTLVYRILKLQDSLFVYIGNTADETFDGLGLSFVLNNQSTASSIISVESNESQDLAQKLSLRLNKPVFVSSNTNVDRISRPLIEQRLVQEIKEFPEYF